MNDQTINQKPSCSNEVGDLENMPLIYDNKEDEIISENLETGKSFHSMRVINSISLIILLLSVFSVFYYNGTSLKAFHQTSNPKRTHFQADIIVLEIIWGLIISM